MKRKKVGVKDGKKKEVCFCMYSFPVGGGERVVSTIMNHLIRDGWVVTLILFKKKGGMIAELDSKINIVSFDGARYKYGMLKLIRYLIRNKPPVIVSSSIQMNPVVLLARSFAYKSRTKVLIRVGSPLSVIFERRKGLRDNIIGYITKIMYKKANHVVAVSRGIADDVVKYTKASQENVSVIYNPVNKKMITEKAQYFVPDVFTKKRGPYIVSVGRMAEQKDFLSLIKAHDLLLKNGKDAHLIIVGDGGERVKIEKKISELSLENKVTLVGYQKNPYSYMKNADVFVLSSLWEGLPNVLLEALVCGVKVVATDSFGGGSREIIAPGTDSSKSLRGEIEKGKYGVLATAGDHESIAKAIEVSLTLPERKNIPAMIDRSAFDSYASIISKLL